MLDILDFSAISVEWLDSNKSRAYPFDESTADVPGRIPTPVFTDALLITTTSEEVLYVSKVIRGQTSFQVYLGTEGAGSSLQYLDISYSTKSGTKIDVDIDFPSGAKVFGFFIVGDVEHIKYMPDVNEMTADNGALFPGCVRRIGGGFVTSISVDDDVFTGNVRLIAGDGIELTVTENDVTKTTDIVISAESYKLPGAGNTDITGNMYVTSDDDLVNAITENTIGLVKTINGVEPDDTGNIDLLYDISATGERAECEGSVGAGNEVEGTEGESAPTIEYVPFCTNEFGIILSQPSGSVDIEAAYADLEVAVKNLAELNERCGILEDTITSVDNALNVINSSLARIK